MSGTRAENIISKKESIPIFELVLEYENYLANKRVLNSKKYHFSYRDSLLILTRKQVKVLELVSKGFSNTKIAGLLSRNESSIKLFIYRLAKYLEEKLEQRVDRFSLVLISQEIISKLDSHTTYKEKRLSEEEVKESTT